MSNSDLFDIKLGKEIVGSYEKAIEILDMLMLDLKTFNDTIKTIKNDLVKSYDFIHKTLGASVYCGAPRLQQQLKKAQDKLTNKTLSNSEIIDICNTVDLMLAIWPDQKKQIDYAD